MVVNIETSRKDVLSGHCLCDSTEVTVIVLPLTSNIPAAVSCFLYVALGAEFPSCPVSPACCFPRDSSEVVAQRLQGERLTFWGPAVYQAVR